jgi:transposase, IS30 family
MSSFAIRTLPGSAGPTRTPTGGCASTHRKGTDFSPVTDAELDAVADELNIRPRKRLAFANPTEQLAELLLQ